MKNVEVEITRVDGTKETILNPSSAFFFESCLGKSKIVSVKRR